jgi:hypothetical protein
MITGQSKTTVVESAENIDIGLNSGNALIISVEGTGFSGTVDFQSTIDGENYTNHPYSGYRDAFPILTSARITDPSTIAAYVMLPPVTQARIAVGVSSGSVSIRYIEISFMHEIASSGSDVYVAADGDGSPGDGGHLVFGAGNDATIHYDGANLNINPDLVGSGGVIIGGDLTVTGATTTVSSTTLTIADPLVKYNQTDTGVARDSGFIVTRGNGSATNTANRGFIWDSSEGEFAAIAANTEAGTTSGNVTIDDYVDLRVGAITADDASTFSTSIALASGATVTGIDTNTSLGTSNALLATQGAIKSYVDTVATAADLDVEADSGSAQSIDLDSETLDIAGGTGISTAASTNTVTVNIDSTVTTLTGSQTLTNKTLTAPTLTTPALGTPASGVMTNASGTAANLTAGNVTTNANLTGHIVSSGNATTLGTDSFTSAHLLGALTNETGSGVAVFNTSPTLVTPALGTPASGVMTNMTGLVNAGITASAAIAYSKLAALADGNILVGNGSNVAVSVNPSGDVDISNAGAFSIASGVIVNDDINASAAIAVSKTALSAGTGLTLSTNSLATDASQGHVTTVGTIGTGVWEGTDVGVGHGGTGASSAAAGFDALAPMTAEGDIIYGGSSGTGTRLAKGSDGQVLALSSGVPAWGDAATGDITSVVAGAGMTGGATSGAATVNVIGGDGIAVAADAVAVDLVSNGGLEISGGELQVASGIAQHDIAQYAASVADDDFLRINGTKVEGLSAAEVAAAIEGSIDAVGTIASGVWNGTAIANGYLANSAVTITAGTGLTGGGSTALGASSTVNVIGGTGITANANDMAVTAAQTGITSVINTNLVVGTSLTGDFIDFGESGIINVELSDVLEFQFAADGNFHADSDVFAYSGTTASDRNLKKNIVEISEALDKVKALHGVTFDYKEEHRGSSVGLIAQDVQAIYPELVKEAPKLGKENETYLSLNYDGIIGLLVEAVKELAAKVGD